MADGMTGNVSEEYGHYVELPNGMLHFVTTAKHCGKILIRIFPHQGHIPAYYCEGCKQTFTEGVE